MMFFSQRLIREEWEALEKKEREEEEKRERARRGKVVGSVSRWTLCFLFIQEVTVSSCCVTIEQLDLVRLDTGML